MHDPLATASNHSAAREGRAIVLGCESVGCDAFSARPRLREAD